MTQVSGTRTLRHELLNQVNHIVGYAELGMEELGDRAFVEIRAAGGQVLTAIERLLDPAAREVDADELRRALEGPLGVVSQLARETAVDNVEAAQFLNQIGTAADRARQLLAEQALSEPALAARSDAFTRPGESRGLVLVVDDDSGNRDLLRRRLDRLGYAVLQAENGRAALDLMRSAPVDLVLLDLDMPEMDGYQVLQVRQADAALRDIPTIMISASAGIDSVVRCIEMGAEDHLGKPFNPVLLEARLGACMEKKRLRDQERELAATVARQAQALAEWNETLERRVVEQIQELERMTRLRRFLSGQIADLVVSAGAEDVLKSHRRDIAVLFVDLSGFTAFSETSEPEEVMSVLREFHAELGALVSEFEATVGFFAGDGLMVFWNDPLPCPNPAERAVRMAVAMRDRLGRLAGDWRRQGHEVGFAIGVSFGYATVGEIGFDGRYDYGVIGSVVNLAARLCDRADQGQILVTARAKLATEGIARTEAVGEVTLKGFHAPVAAYEVVGLEPSA